MSTDIQKIDQAFSAQELQLIRTQLCPKANEEQFNLFIWTCISLKLNPFKNQIFAVFRGSKEKDQYGNEKWVQKMALQIGIAGLRAIAQENQNLTYLSGALFMAKGGPWVEVWEDETTPPYACKMEGARVGMTAPTYEIVRYSTVVQTYDVEVGGNKVKIPNSMWTKRGAEQLAKCTEAALLRKLCPDRCAGLYIPEESGWASEGQEKAPQQRGTIQPQAQTLQIEGQTVTVDPPKLGINERRALATTLEEINALWAEAQQTDHWQAWDGVNREKCRTSFVPFADKFGGKWMEAENKFMTESEVLGETSQADFLKGLEENPDSVGNGSDFKTQFPTS